MGKCSTCGKERKNFELKPMSEGFVCIYCLKLPVEKTPGTCR